MGTMRSGRGFLSMDKVGQVLGPSMGSLHLLLWPDSAGRLEGECDMCHGRLKGGL